MKPSNVLFASDGSIRLCDFDSSKRIGDTIPTLDDLRCSLPFVAPEVLDGAKPTSGADIYSFGATIWTLLAGHDPLNLATETPVTAAVIAATNRRFSFHDLAIASASSDICSLFEQCLNPDPTLRPTAAVGGCHRNSSRAQSRPTRRHHILVGIPDDLSRSEQSSLHPGHFCLPVGPGRTPIHLSSPVPQPNGPPHPVAIRAFPVLWVRQQNHRDNGPTVQPAPIFVQGSSPRRTRYESFSSRRQHR